MESMGGIAEGEYWSSLTGMYTIEETDFMTQLLNSFPIHDDDELNGFSNTGFSSTFSSSASHIDNSFYSYGPNFVVDNNTPMSSMDFCMENTAITTSYLVQPALPDTNLEFKAQPEPTADKKRDAVSENSKKRSSSSVDHVRKNWPRNSRSKKKKNNVSTTTNDEDCSNEGLKGQSCSSEDDSNASKGSSGTESQSLYAKKRRERINERLRILQNLVPNGTKVDISTMLEEAVQYVKFLQQQIKMLSCDDLWMYAPIAYNGMDIGLVHLNLPKQQ